MANIFKNVTYFILSCALLLMAIRAVYFLGNYLAFKIEGVRGAWDVAIECETIRASDHKEDSWTYNSCVENLSNSIPDKAKLLKIIL